MEFKLDSCVIHKNEIKDMIDHVLKEKSYQFVSNVNIEGAVTKEPVAFKDKDTLTYKAYQRHESWGDLFDCAWFKLTGKIENHRNRKLYIKLDISGEALLFTKEGNPLKGFTNGSSVFDRNYGEPGKLYYLIDALIEEDGSFELWFDAGANDLFGTLQNQGKILFADIVERRDDIRQLYYDVQTLYDLLEITNQEDDKYKKLFQDLREIYFHVIYEKRHFVEHATKIAKKWLDETSDEPLTVHAIGHSHMDLAWLWPIRETKRKIGRTIANMLNLLKQYPNFKYGISQPQQIEWLRIEYPQLFESFKAYVKEGRIELQGGMWVEADTNISGGESLIRQIHYGQSYYQDMFGVTVNNLWLPDVFGYSGSIPQIMKGSGLDYFMTIKIAWSLFNQFPHHTFVWEGIDGSQVITHMPPEGTYNSSIRPQALKNMANDYIEKEDIPHALNLFGIGDGGGGPGYEHLERIERTKNIKDLPKINITTAASFFELLEQYKDKMKVYKGELYLENHQGTLTSQANLKKAHRRMEQTLKTVEILLTTQGVYDVYKTKLDEIWKEHLLFEFHDILPGSSIKRVYDECLERYEVLFEMVDQILKDAFQSYTSIATRTSFPYNSNPFDVFHLEKIEDAYILYHIKPYSNACISIDEHSYEGNRNDRAFQLKDYYVTFDHLTGQILRLMHLETKTELLINHTANHLSVYKDLGDAWNILDHYREQEAISPTLTRQTVKKYGRFFEVQHHYEVMNSTIDERVILDTHTNQITFQHDVDWQDVGYMLRTNFPLEIHSKDAIFDIQFGEIKRPRTTENSLDKAKFEVCGHHWGSIHDGKFGASIISDCKYGYHVQNNNFDLNLLRSTNYPAVSGDIGRTSYTYQLILHRENHVKARIDSQGLILNSYYPHFTERLHHVPFLDDVNEHIDISTIKRSNDASGIIIRCYEKHGKEVKTRLQWVKKPKKVYRTNLLEEDAVLLDDQQLTFKPYQIITLKVIY